jgi:hypothetical protein
MTKARDLANAARLLDNVTATQLGYLSTVTSAVQTQINSKQAVVANVDDTELGYLNGVTSAIQTQLDAKLASSTAATTYQAINANVSTTELGYLDGVTSAIQTQLDVKVPLVQPITTPTFTSNAYTLLSTDKDKVVLLTNGATAGTVTIPTGTYATGTVLTLVQTGAGQITIASSGTRNSNGNKYKFNGQWATCQVIVTATDTFLLIGNLVV